MIILKMIIITCKLISSTQPTISQFLSFKIRRLAKKYKLLANVHRWLLGLSNSYRVCREFKASRLFQTMSGSVVNLGPSKFLIGFSNCIKLGFKTLEIVD